MAYVERVISADEIMISDDNWGGDFHWHRVTRSGGGWPSGFIHFRDVALRNKQEPAVLGTPQVGQTLTATTGVWSSAPGSYTYQWFADGVAIKGATLSTLVVAPGRVGQQLSVRVTATATGYAAATAASVSTVGVAPGVITTVAEPVVTGEPLVGKVLTATQGVLRPGVDDEDGPVAVRRQADRRCDRLVARARPGPGRHGRGRDCLGDPQGLRADRRDLGADRVRARR